jgi:hypothetical protein
MKWSALSTHFIQAMVHAAYREDRNQVNNPDLMSGAELLDFYYAYMDM